jgi:hypothetical protein
MYRFDFKIIIIFIITFVYSVLINLYNINEIKLLNNNSTDLIFGSTLYSPDNLWYLYQIRNFIDGNGFTIDPLDPIYAVRRTPGYPIFYGIQFYILGEIYTHKIIPYIQTLLHSIAAVYIYKIAKLLKINNINAFWTALFYGFSPFIVSFLFMTITESISSSFIVICLYSSLLTYEKKSYKQSILTGFLVGITILISPRNIIFLMIFIPLIIKYLYMGKIILLKINIFASLSLLFVMLPWIIHNYIKIDKFIPLETYYLNHTMEDQNIKNISLYQWWSTWENPEGVRLHSQISEDIGSVNPYQSIDIFIEKEIPDWIIEIESKKYIKELLIDYQNCIIKNKADNGGRRLRYLEIPNMCEYEVASKLDSYRLKIEKKYPFKVYVVSPLYKRGFKYIFHSTIHNWKSFENYKNNGFKYTFKSISYLINVILWFVLFILIAKDIIKGKLLFLTIVPISSFLFLVYYRHVEGRYLIQIYPFLYLLFGIFYDDISKKVLNKYRDKTI